MTTCLKPTYFGPCRKCKPCLERRQRSWLLRMLLEAMLYDSDTVTFFTFTYRPEDLPTDENSAKISMQKFFKRLRKIYPDRSIRYVVALESGTQATQRYHWHGILYGVRFTGANRHVLDKTWGHGWIDWKPSSAGRMHYVLKYVIKGSKFLMSRRPGIGAGMVEPLQSMIDTLTPAECIKLRGNFMSLHYPDRKEGLARLRVGKYDYPIHRYLKDRLLKPPVKIDFDQAQSLLNEIHFGGYTNGKTFTPYKER